MTTLLHVLHFASLLVLFHYGSASTDPEQVHLSLTGDLSQMYVAWLTMSPVNAQTFVKYGPSQNDLKYTVVSEDVHSFIDNGAQHSVRYVNTAKMVNLKPDSYYYYSVGSVRGMSKVFRFKTFPQGEFPIRICIYGDLGIVNGQFDDIINGAEKDYDMVIHVGDIAYDLFKEDGTYGDEFFRKMEPVTSSMPYMVIPGNHEQEPAQDFLHYRKRMKMPGKTEGYYYSFDVGLFHFAGLNSEFYALEWIQQAKDQYNWLEKDLDKVTVPWIFTAIHRPMYCSNSGYSEDCNRPDNEVIRVGNSQMPGLEKLYRDKGVDFAFYGHMHSYERMWPVYNKVTYEQPKAGLTYNSPTPIHVITGSAGCHTPHTPQDSNEKWSCVRSEDFGFTIVHLHNSTHAHLRQFSTEQHRNVDDYWLVKQKGYRPGQA